MSNFKVGDKVHAPNFGDGEVVSVRSQRNANYPIEVKFDGYSHTSTFSLNGHYNVACTKEYTITKLENNVSDLTARDLLQALLDGKTLIHRKSTNTRQLFLLKDNSLSRDGATFDLSLPTLWEIKPDKITINGFDVPAPESIAPERPTPFYIPSLFEHRGYDRYVWYDNAKDHELLRDGLVHLCEENAIAHKNALISITKVPESLFERVMAFSDGDTTNEPDDKE
jgi:hypothetical protein